jgi:hypothetical protein
MSLVDHDVVCFMLNDGESICWLIEVNLKKKVLGSVALYIDEEDETQAATEEQASWADIVGRSHRSFFGRSIIPIKFTMYLDEHSYLDKHTIKR